MVVYSYVTITNVNDGEKGDTGATLYTWIKYSNGSPESMTDDPDGATYIGIAYNKTGTEESDDYDDYRWTLMKGRSIQSITIEYALSSSKTTAPAENSSDWSETPPAYVDGKYMWSRTKIQYVDPISTEYSTALCDNNWDIFTDKISSVEQKVDNNTKEISLKASTTYVTEAIHTAIEESENTTNKKIAELTVRDDKIAASVSSVESELKNKASGADVASLTTRVGKLELTDSNFEVRISSTESQMTSWENSKSNLSMFISVANEETSTVADADDSHVQTTSTLSVHLYKGSTEITNTFTATKYVWTRRSELTTEDIAWNAENRTGTSITLSPEDKVNAAVYKCSIDITATNSDGVTETFPVTAETTLYNDYFIANWTTDTSSNISAQQGIIDLIVSQENIADLSNGGTTMYNQLSSLNIGLNGITSRVESTENEIGNHENRISIVEQTQSQWSVTLQQHGDQLTEMSSYMSYAINDETGKGTLTLGEQDNAFQLQLTNERMEFLDSGTPIAWLSNKHLNITDAQVDNINATTGAFVTLDAQTLNITGEFRIGNFIGKARTSGVRSGNVSWLYSPISSN